MCWNTVWLTQKKLLTFQRGRTADLWIGPGRKDFTEEPEEDSSWALEMSQNGDMRMKGSQDVSTAGQKGPGKSLRNRTPETRMQNCTHRPWPRGSVMWPRMHCEDMAAPKTNSSTHACVYVCARTRAHDSHAASLASDHSNLRPGYFLPWESASGQYLKGLPGGANLNSDAYHVLIKLPRCQPWRPLKQGRPR